MFVRYCTLFFFSVDFCVVLPSCYRRQFHPLDFFFQSSSGNCACTLVLLFFGHQRHHIIINVSQSKCDYLVFSVFDYGGVCTSHEMYIVDLAGWMECTVLCKSTSVFVLMRDVFTIGRF